MSRMKAHPRVFWHRLKDHVRRFGWIWLAVFLILSLVNNRWHVAMNRSHSLPFKLFVIERGQKDVTVGDYVALVSTETQSHADRDGDGDGEEGDFHRIKRK